MQSSTRGKDRYEWKMHSRGANANKLEHRHRTCLDTPNYGADTAHSSVGVEIEFFRMFFWRTTGGGRGGGLRLPRIEEPSYGAY